MYKYIQKPLEIPYNFDLNLINFLILYKSSLKIHCIYCCPFFDDYITAKHSFIKIKSSDTIKNNFQIDRMEYEKQIQYINQHFPNKLMLLLQQKNIIMDEYQLNYYINLGFKIFCVGSIQQAKIIKNLNPNLEIIGSITMGLKTSEEFLNFDNNFNGFVLYFPFNRNLEQIKQLPKQFKYSLLINSGCCINCNGVSHWFANDNEEKQIICPRNTISNDLKNNIFIRPNDLFLFNDYIDYFKIVGREIDTIGIIRDLIIYSTDLNHYYIPFNIDINKLYNIK